jgi:hypothetical protein
MKTQHLGLWFHGTPISRGMHRVGKRRNPKAVRTFFNYIRIYFDLILFTVPGSEWAKVVQAEYQAQIASLDEQSTNPEAITELFQPQIEWYRERLQANVRETKKSGKFDLTIGHYAKLVTNLVCHCLVSSRSLRC